MKKSRLKNKFERKLYNQLKKAKVNFGYESVSIPYVIAGNYRPDFVLDTPTGIVYIEAKGYLRPEHKRKMVAVKRQHPEKDIRIVFYRKSASTSRWAERHGFRYVAGEIPKDWLKGL